MEPPGPRHDSRPPAPHSRHAHSRRRDRRRDRRRHPGRARCAQAPFAWDRQVAGLAGVKASGDPLPQATLDSIRRTRLALKGPLETPSGGGYRSSNVRLREEFQLYANLRPARTIIPGGRFDNIDLVVVRENLEGLYIGHEHYVQIDDDPHAVAMATGINTRAGSRRLLEFAFDHAVRPGARRSRSCTRPTS